MMQPPIAPAWMDLYWLPLGAGGHLCVSTARSMSASSLFANTGNRAISTTLRSNCASAR